MLLKNESLTNWITENLLSVKEINERTIEIAEVGKFLLIEPKSFKESDKQLLFDNEFQIVLNTIEDKYCNDVDFLLFEFGSKWYYTDSLTPEVIHPFKYLGKAEITFHESTVPVLGTHGGYELCGGSALYTDWCKKAKFLGVDTLGICELNTLAGTLDFQSSCKDAGIKPIIGETITILTTSKAKINIKIYVQDEEGWINLLWINKIINVDNTGEYITEEQLLNKDLKTEGLIVVLSPEVDLDIYFQKFDFYFSDVYYQIDFVEWSSQSRDEFWLNSLKHYLENYYIAESTTLRPIIINDAYYLDKEDHIIRPSLNTIGKVGFKNQSKDQFFKSIDDVFLQALGLFSETDERCVDLLDSAISNTKKLCAEIDFKIPTGQFRLPEYEMSEEENLLHDTNEDLFWSKIEKGVEEKVFNKVADEQIYLDRIQMEAEVIKKGGFIDYFLIIADIIRWCKTQDILVGIGRGSSAGSLIAYCLDITKIDPIKYDLIFQRFLNEGRLSKSVSQEYFIIESENGIIEFKANESVQIMRENRKIKININELQINDYLI